MLVIDRVELTPLHQAKKVGELQGDQTGVLDERSETCREVPDVRNVGKDVVGHDEIGASAALGDVVPVAQTEELHLRWDPESPGRLGHVLGGLDAQDRDPLGNKMLQQIAVVACDFGDKALVTSGRAGRPSNRQTAWRGRPRSPSRKRSTRSQRRSLHPTRTPAAAPGGRTDTAAHAADRRPRVDRVGPPRRSFRTAATCRDRRRCA